MVGTGGVALAEVALVGEVCWKGLELQNAGRQVICPERCCRTLSDATCASDYDEGSCMRVRCDGGWICCGGGLIRTAEQMPVPCPVPGICARQDVVSCQTVCTVSGRSDDHVMRGNTLTATKLRIA
jgi:hypothetical protein